MPSMLDMLNIQNHEAARDRILMYCDSYGLSVNAFARRSGVSQSSLSRFLNGKRKRVSFPPSALKALRYIHREHKKHSRCLDNVDQEGQFLINEAISSIWDGSLQSAELLAPLIHALKPALDAIKFAQTTGHHQATCLNKTAGS